MPDIKDTTDESYIDETGAKRLKKFDPTQSKMQALKERGQKRLDDWLTENVVNPVAESGYENAAAALATIPSTAYAYLPDNEQELAMAVTPIGKLGKLGSLEKAEAKMAGKAEGEASKVYNSSQKAAPDFGDGRYPTLPVKETYVSEKPLEKLKDNKVRDVKFPGQSETPPKKPTPVANPKRR